MRLWALGLACGVGLGMSDVARAADASLLQSASPAPAWLGVSMDPGGADGVVVKHVVRASPAEKAGVKAGDRIVRVDGLAVARAAEVTRAVAQHGAGEAVTLGLARAGKELALKVTLGPRPSADEMLRQDHVGAFAPAWMNVSPIGGAPKTLAQLKGRVVVLDFWATWCGPCRMIAPRLSALQARFGAQGLTVVGMTTDAADSAAAFAARTDMKYGIVVDGNAETTRAYGVTGLPTMFIIDKRGVVRAVEVGFDPSSEGQLTELVTTLLAEPATQK